MNTIDNKKYQSRLDPFVFPSETTLRFALLIVSVIAASLFIYETLYFQYLEINGKLEPVFNLARNCLNQSLNQDFSVFSSQELTAAGNALSQCSTPLEKVFAQSTWFAIVSVGILLGFALILYGVFPSLMIQREGMISLEKDTDMKDIVIYLKNLCQEVGINPPIFLQKPASRGIGGRAFGSFGRYYVILPTGLLFLFDTNQDIFRAIMLHELAHLRNKDVDKTYFSIVLVCVFVLIALIPFLISLLNNSGAEFFQASWRIIALILLVYLTLTSVIRAREFYADVRASTFPHSQALLSMFETAKKPELSAFHTNIIALLERLPFFRRNHWQFAFLVHPQSSQRRHILVKTDPLFRIDFWVAFGTGMAATVGYESVASLIRSLLKELFGRNDVWLESLGAGLIFASLVVGIIGLGIWRTTFVSLIRDQHFGEIGKLGIGLGLGLIVGQAFSFHNITSYQHALGWEQLDLGMQFALITFKVFWSILLLISLYYFFQWVATSASIWLSIAMFYPSPRLFYTLGLLITGLCLTFWFAVLFTIQIAEPLLLTLNSFEASLVLIPLSFITIDVSFQSPLTLTALASLWAFPLSAWFWKTQQTQLMSVPQWGFLGSIPDQLPINNQKILQIRLVLRKSLMSGLQYCILLLILRLGIRLIVPESIRSTGALKLMLFYVGHIGLAALMQARVAVKITQQANYFKSIQGLFAAFSAGCLMSLGALIINFLLGGSLNTQFIWDNFSKILNWGALLSLIGIAIVSKQKIIPVLRNS